MRSHLQPISMVASWKIGRRLPISPFFIVVVLLSLNACSPIGGNQGNVRVTPSATKAATIEPAPVTATLTPTTDICPAGLSRNPNCHTPHALRVAYGLEALTERGFTGKGQTVVDIVSYGSPTLQQDMDIFDKQFGLPAIKIKVISPLGTTLQKRDQAGWAAETELDVQIIHAIAPDAGIVVLTSPVAETEGTIGLPEFLQLEQYAVSHHLGQIFSQSYVASETTLSDSTGKQLVNTYANFYQHITTQLGWTIVSGSGDNGATDFIDLAGTKLSHTPIVNFPADVPWVTAVGGTSLTYSAGAYNEIAWPGSGGGFSKFFAKPAFQQNISRVVQAQFANQRGIPDVAADANPFTGMAFYLNGRWRTTGGTSASTPLWAGMIAVANQMAGRALGFINPGIYKVAASANGQRDFRDIVSGNNNVNVRSVKFKGYDAAPGWDAVTGWGAPDAAQLLPDLIATLKG